MTAEHVVKHSLVAVVKRGLVSVGKQIFISFVIFNPDFGIKNGRRMVAQQR